MWPGLSWGKDPLVEELGKVCKSHRFFINITSNYLNKRYLNKGKNSNKSPNNSKLYGNFCNWGILHRKVGKCEKLSVSFSGSQSHSRTLLNILMKQNIQSVQDVQYTEWTNEKYAHSVIFFCEIWSKNARARRFSLEERHILRIFYKSYHQLPSKVDHTSKLLKRNWSRVYIILKSIKMSLYRYSVIFYLNK